MSDEIADATALVRKTDNLVGKEASKQMIDWGFGSGKAEYLTTIDQSAHAGRVEVFKMLNGKYPNLDDYFNNEIQIVGFLISPIDLVSEMDGSTVRLPMSRMILADGSILQTTAKAVAECLIGLACNIRKPPWNPPMVCIPRKVQTKGGKSYYVLVPMSDGFDAKWTEKNSKKVGK